SSWETPNACLHTAFLSRYFRKYLLPGHFYVRTDHEIVYLRSGGRRDEVSEDALLRGPLAKLDVRLDPVDKHLYSRANGSLVAVSWEEHELKREARCKGGYGVRR